MSEPKKQEIITFKVDEALRRAMQGVQNRSEFIRAAILAALDSVCPLCKGSGILTPDQRKHWETFREEPSSAPMRRLPRGASDLRGGIAAARPVMSESENAESRWGAQNGWSLARLLASGLGIGLDAVVLGAAMIAIFGIPANRPSRRWSVAGSDH